MDIVELGLFYDAEIDGPNVKVQYTLTSMGCPAGAMIQEDIERAVRRDPRRRRGHERPHVRAAVDAGQDVRRREVHPRLRLSPGAGESERTSADRRSITARLPWTARAATVDGRRETSGMVAGQVREDVVLRDGSTLRLRQTSQDDQAALVEFFERLSPDTRHLRFQGAIRVDAHLAMPFLHSDGEDALSLVAELADPAGDTRIVALGTFIRLRDASRAEVAFVVADDMQRRGIGSRLLERLAVHARRVGIERFVAQVLPENGAMLRVFGDTGFEVQRRYVDGVVEVEFKLTASADVLERTDRRDHSAVAASLELFFRPRSVAVIGASARRGTIGGELFRNVIAGDFDGTAYPVNPQARRSEGCQAYHFGRGDPRAGRARRDLRPGRAGDRCRALGTARGDPGAVRRLGRVCGDGHRRRRAPGGAARARPRPRRAPDRPELPRHRVDREAPQRDVRPSRVPGRTCRLLVAERCARPRTARAGGAARSRPVRIRVDRQQGRCLVERPAGVLGGRPRDGRRAAVPRVVRQPAQVRARRGTRCALEADPGHAERPQPGRRARGRVAYRRARRQRCGHRRAVPPGRRAARGRRCRSCSTPPCSSLRCRLRRASASRSSPTPAASASSAPTRAKRPGSFCRSSPRRRVRRLRRSRPSRRVLRIPSTCSARRTPPPTRRCSGRSWPTRTSTP